MTSLAVLGVIHVLTQRYDDSRSGANLDEVTLTTANVNVTRFGKLFSRAVDGSLYAQPLYVSGLALAGGAPRNVVFLATMHNTVYAFDADDPAAAEPLWVAHLEPPVPLPDPRIGTHCNTGYKDILEEIGILGTPVIDLKAGLLYAVTATRGGDGEEARYDHRLHALDIRTGAEALGGPVTLAATVPGTGAGAEDGRIGFESLYQNQRVALTLAHGRVYIGFASYCDSGPYHGWLLAYDAATLALARAWNDTPDGEEAGIWQSGTGVNVDESGDLFLTTGNGTLSYHTGGQSLGNAVVRLSPDLEVRDWFVPFDWQRLNDLDGDLGSTGVLRLPGTDALVTGSKGGNLYVLRRGELGHVGAGNDSQIIQRLGVAVAGGIFGTPVAWNGPKGLLAYVWAGRDRLKAYHWGGTRFDALDSSGTISSTSYSPGGILALSANGDKAGSGIVWGYLTLSGSPNQGYQPGVLRAFDAADVSKELWNSTLDLQRDDLGIYGKFSTPVVVAGKVYLGTFSKKLQVYGLLPPAITLTAAPRSIVFGEAVTLAATVAGPKGETASGSITLSDGAAPLGSAALDGEGRATLAVPLLGGGAHTLRGAYAGDDDVNAGVSPPLTLEVARASCTASVAAPAMASGKMVTVTVRVAASPATKPSGKVTLTREGAPAGEVTLDATGGGSATIALGDGDQAVAASYGGDANYAPCASPPATVRVDEDGGCGVASGAGDGSALLLLLALAWRRYTGRDGARPARRRDPS